MKFVALVLIFCACAGAREKPNRPALRASQRLPGQADSAAYIRGVIESREPLKVGVKYPSGETRMVTISRMLVAADRVIRAEEFGRPMNRDRAWLSVDSTTCIINRAGGQLSAEALTIGRHVTVWAGENFLASNPPQGGATKVIVDDNGLVSELPSVKRCG
jgi:hypothetical protein